MGIDPEGLHGDGAVSGHEMDRHQVLEYAISTVHGKHNRQGVWVFSY